MEAEPGRQPDAAPELEATETEAEPAAEASPEPLTVGNGSQVIAVTINLNLPVFGSVVYATRRALPPALGGKVFEVVRRVVGTARPGVGSGEAERPDDRSTPAEERIPELGS